MMLSRLNKKWMVIVLIVALLTLLAGTLTGCAELEQWTNPPKASEEKEAATETEKPPALTVKTEDRVILLIYEHLLSQAESHMAKSYLADFYTVCDKWSAETELLRDGTTVWHVVVDMTGVEEWDGKLHWQLASWFAFPDGRVIPSNRFQANALRIEADLQELSPSLELSPEPESKPEE